MINNKILLIGLGLKSKIILIAVDFFRVLFLFFFFKYG